MGQSIVVLGARNLGGAIVDHFLGLGWNAAGVARSPETLDAVRSRGALAVSADASDPDQLAGAFHLARRELGSLDAIVNAVSAARPPGGGPFGGGELAAADVAAFRGWTVAVAEQAFAFLSTGARALRESGGGTLVQITGGSSRRRGRSPRRSRSSSASASGHGRISSSSPRRVIAGSRNAGRG